MRDVNLSLNADAAPNSKHIFGPHRGPPHISESSQSNIYNRKQCDERNQTA